MNLEYFNDHLEAYKNQGQILDAAAFVMRFYGLEHENFAGFAFRDEISPTTVLLTAEGELGEKQTVKIPRNLFDFDMGLVLNIIAHEMLHVRQKAPGQIVADKNEREFQAYYEMLFHKTFPLIPQAKDFFRSQFATKALEYYRRMGEGSALQQKYGGEREEVQQLLGSMHPTAPEQS